VSQSPAGVAVLSVNKVSPTGCGCRQQALKQGLLQLGGGLHQCKEWCGLGSSTPESTTTALQAIAAWVVQLHLSVHTHVMLATTRLE
jgi:hypothetical protein